MKNKGDKQGNVLCWREGSRVRAKEHVASTGELRCLRQRLGGKWGF